MSDKVSTLILKVDLDCHLCYKKIRKILCKLQDKERIMTISYDEGSNSIAVVGSFDPHKLSCMIRCMAGKVIRGVDIIMHEHESGGKPPTMAGPPPEPMNNGKKKKKKHKEMDPPPPAEPEPEQHPPPPPVENPPPDSHMTAAMPAMIEEERPRERPGEMVEYVPPMEMPPPPPAAEPGQRLLPPAPKPVWPACETMTTLEIPPVAAAAHCGCSCCQPCYQGYYEACRCSSCGGGRVYGYGVPMPAAGWYRPPPPRCQVYCEEDPPSACTVM